MMRIRLVSGILSVAILFVVVGCEDPMGDALLLERDGDWEGALAIYQQVLADNPEDTDAMSGMATGLWLLGRYDEALPFQLEVVARDPDDVETRVELAFNYMNHQGSASHAVSVLREAVDIERSARLLTYLGQAQREMGDLEGAEDAFSQAIVADVTYAYAYRQLFRLLDEQGRSAEAASVKASAESNGVELTQGED